MTELSTSIGSMNANLIAPENQYMTCYPLTGPLEGPLKESLKYITKVFIDRAGYVIEEHKNINMYFSLFYAKLNATSV